MTFYVENEILFEFEFSINDIIEKLMIDVLESEYCPYEAQINILLTNNEGIKEFNLQYRNIDRETDVLSFPNIDFDVPGNFDHVEENLVDYFDPDSGELILGDIILSVDKVLEQAKEYDHSIIREFAFLITHSLLHLCGYDHMESEDAKIMEEKQKNVLERVGITRG